MAEGEWAKGTTPLQAIETVKWDHVGLTSGEIEPNGLEEDILSAFREIGYTLVSRDDLATLLRMAEGFFDEYGRNEQPVLDRVKAILHD